MKRYTLIILMLFVVLEAKSQDIHFTQIINTPMLINPANTGAFDAEHRVFGNYKSQWRNISKSYLTYGLSYDMSILKKHLRGGKLGIGIQFFHDRAGINMFTQTYATLSLAYHLKVNRSNFISTGIQAGINQNTIDESNMQWDSQYDPNAPDGYNSGLPSGETLSYSKKLTGDVSAGMAWSYNSSPGTLSSYDARRFTVGVSLFHINRPRQSFSGSDNSRTYMKLVVHAQGFIGLRNSRIGLVPTVAWFNQGPSNEILLGSLFRYCLKDPSKYTTYESETAVAIGVHYRVGDAIIPSVQFEWKYFLLNIGYDVNISKLSAATKGAGGIEVGLRFMTPLFNGPNVRQF